MSLLDIKRIVGFEGGGFTPHSMVFIPDDKLLCVLDKRGKIHLYDTVLGRSIKCTDPVADGSHSNLSVSNGRLVVSSDTMLNVRKPLDGVLLTDTLFQSPKHVSNANVMIEVLASEVPLLLHELKTRSYSDKDDISPRIIDTLTSYEAQNNKSFIQTRWCPCVIEGPVGPLTTLFANIFSIYSTKSADGHKLPQNSPAISSILSSIVFRLKLLHPSHDRFLALEYGSESLVTNDTNLMYAEGIRRISLRRWPHSSYLWATPKNMAESGLYMVPGTSSISQTRRDFTSCFTCSMTVHRWLASDEPWSEHTKHSNSCPFMRGCFTINVPKEISQATTPSVACDDSITCISSCNNDHLVAIATVDNNITIWNTDNILYTTKHAKLKITDFTVVNITSLCFVTMDTVAEATPTKTPAERSPSLVIGTTLSIQENKVPSILVYVTQPNIPKDSDKMGMVKPPPASAVDYDVYDFIFDEQSPDGGLPIPTLPPTTGPHPLSLKEGECPYVCSRQQIIQLAQYKVTVEEDCVPVINNIITIPNLNLLVYSLRMDTSSDHVHHPAGGIGVFELTRTDDNTVINETSMKQVTVDITDPSDLVTSMCWTEVLCDGNNRTQYKRTCLLCVTAKGSLKVYDLPGLNEVYCYTMEGVVLSHVVSCDSTSGVVAVASVEGKIELIGIRNHVEKSENTDQSNVIESLKDCSVTISNDMLSMMGQLQEVDHNGTPYTALVPPHWVEVNPFRFYQNSPRHMLQTQSADKCMEGSMFNTKIWKYSPELMSANPTTSTDSKHFFQINLSSSSPISSLRVKLSFATSECISNDATLSLYQLRNPAMNITTGASFAGSDNISDWFEDVVSELLCGPVPVKQFVDISDQSLTVSLTHPSLLCYTSTNHAPVLLLCFEHLFVSHYNSITEEASKSLASKSVETEPLSSRSRRMHGLVHRQRGGRRHAYSSRPPPPTKSIHSCLLVTIFPANDKLNKNVKENILECLFHEEIVTKLLLITCRHSMERKELSSLKQCYQDLCQREQTNTDNLNREALAIDHRQSDALGILCWMVSVAYSNGDRTLFLSMTSLITSLMTSLLYSCLISGSRDVAHRCARLLIMLSRPFDHSPQEVTPIISSSIMGLVPLLPLVQYSSAMYWLLRQVSFYCPPETSSGMLQACMEQLLRLSKLKESHDESVAQILLTKFNHDATVLQPDLFDIYISYYPKPPLIATPSSSYTPAVSGAVVEYDEFDQTSATVTTPAPTVTGDKSKTIKSTQAIFDSELLLLLRGSHLPNWAVSGKEKECTSFHHGSHLLYTHRGLLETLPLSYTCTITGPGSSCKDGDGASNGAKGADPAPRSESLLAAYLNVHKPSKNLGYMFSYKHTVPAANPSTATSQAMPTSKATTTSSLPSTITNIPDMPKELYLYIDSLKPGSLYTAVIDFHHPVYLTDLTFQISSYMTSVVVDVWLDEGLEGVQKQRLAQSCELKTRSLILGNIMPPVLCQYARISYVAHTSAANEKCVAPLGCFYGLPYFPPGKPLSIIEDGLQSEISKTLAQYYKAREELLDTVSMYKRCPSSSYMLKQQMEKQILVMHTDCFHIQVRLARLKNIIDSVTQSDSRCYTIEALKHEVDTTVSQLPLKKLLKLTGCLVDSILIILEQNALSASSLVSEPTISQDVFRSLFLAHCVHGMRTMHAKTCAVLIHLCGGQSWWGQALAGLFKELFSSNQSQLFNKERTLLQFSALSLRTVTTSDVIEQLLTLLSSNLPFQADPSQFICSADYPTYDTQLVQWLTLFIAHVFTSMGNKKSDNWSLECVNVFAPMYSLSSSSMVFSDGTPSLATPADKPSAKTSAQSMRRSRSSTDLITSSVSTTSHKGKGLEPVNEAETDSKEAEPDSKETETDTKDEVAKAESHTTISDEIHVIESLPHGLLRSTSIGLMHLLVHKCLTRSWGEVPAICKVMSHLLNSQFTCSFLHLLISQDTLQHFLTSLYLVTPHSDSHSSEQEWGQYAVEMLIFELLVQERKELFSMLSKKDKSPSLLATDNLHEEEIINDKQSDVPVKREEETPVAMATPPPMSPPPIASPLTKLKHLQSLKKKKDILTATLVKKSDGVTKILKLDPSQLNVGYVLSKSTVISPGHSAANHSTGGIISNAVDCSLECKSDYSAELQLQIMSNKMYRCMMDGIQNASPLVIGSGTSPVTDNGSDQPETGHSSTGVSSFSMLFTVLDNVFKDSFSNPSANVTGILHFWNEVLQICIKRTKSKQLRTLFGVTNSITSPPLLSQETLSIFLNELITINPTGYGTHSWCLYLFILYLYLKCCKKIGDHSLTINRQQLFDFISKCCVLEITSSSEHRKEFAMDVVFEKFLTCLGQLIITDTHQTGKENMKEQGVELLLSVAVHILRKRSLNGQYFSILLKSLSKEKCLTRLLSTDSPSTGIKTISGFMSEYFTVLVLNTRHSVYQSPLRLLGSVADGERSRRYYASSSTSSHELKWVELPTTETKSDNSTANVKVLEQLFQLFKDISGLILSKTVKSEVVKHVTNTFHIKETDVLKYCKHGYPMLSIVYCDQKLLKLLLQEVCQINSDSRGVGSRQLTEVMKYLKFHCSDFSCWEKPLIDVIATGSGHGQVQDREGSGPVMVTDIAYSAFLYELLNIILKNGQNTNCNDDTPSTEDRNVDQSVSQGCAVALLNRFASCINSLQLMGPQDHTHSLDHAIHELGLQATPKPYKEGSHLVNFLPKASVKTNPQRASFTQLQSTNLRDTSGTTGASRGSSFNFTFQANENWLKVLISFIQPISLSAVHIHQPYGLTQNGPSMVQLEVPSPTRLCKPVPIAPPVTTTGLSGIMIELKSPIITQDLLIRLKKPAVTDNLQFSRMLVLGSLYGSSSSLLADSTATGQPSIDNSGLVSCEGWIGMINMLMSAHPDIVQFMCSTAQSIPNLVPLCMSLLNKSLSPQATEQLTSFLIALSHHNKSIGLNLVLLLFKNQSLVSGDSTSPTDLDEKALHVNVCHVSFLHSLCSPDSEPGCERLVAALRTLHELCDSAPTHLDSAHSLPAFIHTLSNCVWRGKKSSFSLEIPSELFKGLLDVTLSTEITSSIKSPLNTLLTSLCYLNLDWFTDAMETANQILVDRVDGTRRACVLQSFAHCSLSNECMDALLKSSTISLIISSLSSSLQMLSNASQSDSHTSILDLICSDVGFLTSIAFGHVAAQEWLIQKENAFFWPDLLKCFNEPCIIQGDDLSFCQHTVQQFFAVCIKFSEQGKQLLTDLLVNSLIGKYSLEPVSNISGPSACLRLTPFIRTLLVDHLLGPEAVHMIVKIDASLFDSTRHMMKVSSLIPSYVSPHYHPSYPITDNHYYFKMSSENSLSKLLHLFGFEESGKKDEQHSAHIKQKKYLPESASKAKSSTTTTTGAESTRPYINIFNSRLVRGHHDDPAKPTNSIVFTIPDDPDTFIASNTKIKQLPVSSGIGYSQTRTVVISKHSNTDSISTILLRPTYVPMLEVFSQSVGLRLLAHLMSHFYPAVWPVNADIDSFKPDLSTLPLGISTASFLPSHSYVLLCLCLRLQPFGQYVCCNSITGNIWYLLRGALGATDEIEKQLSPPLCTLLSFMPFLFLLRMLIDIPVTVEHGRSIRLQLYTEGIIHHILHCLSESGHYEERRKTKDRSSLSPSQMGTAERKERREKIKKGAAAAASSNEKQYWAKGTGFGTGSTSSTWDMSTMFKENQLRESLVAVCFAILAEWLSLGENHNTQSTGTIGDSTSTIGDSVSEVVSSRSTPLQDDNLIQTEPNSVSEPNLVVVYAEPEVHTIKLTPKEIEAANNSPTVTKTTETRTEEADTQTEGTETQTEKTQTEETETQTEDTETETETQTEETQTEETETCTEETEKTETQTVEAETHTEETETQTEGTETQTEETESQTERTETHTEEAETQTEETKTHTEQAGTQIEETETQTERTETRTEETETQTEEAEAHTETQTEQAETQTEDTETQTEGTETHTEETETQTEEGEAHTETQTEQAETQTEETETQTEGTETQTEGTETQTEEAETQTEETETKTEEAETQTEETETKTEEAETFTDKNKSGTVITEIKILAKSQSNTKTEAQPDIRSESHSDTVKPQTQSTTKAPSDKSSHNESPQEGMEQELDSEVLRYLSDLGCVSPPLQVTLEESCLLPALASHLANDSVLDISKHTQLYKAVLLLIISISRNPLVRPLVLIDAYQNERNDDPNSRNIENLVKNLSITAQLYSKTLGNKKTTVSSSVKDEESQEQGKASAKISNIVKSKVAESQDGTSLTDVINLILRANSEVITVSGCLRSDRILQQTEDSNHGDGEGMSSVLETPSADTPEDYMKIMKQLQFDSYAITEQLDSGKYEFKIAFHYTSEADMSSTATHSPARSLRLAQEVTSLSTSLPLSPSSSVFVRCDEERLDVMKVLITGPSDTPYANGCFLFDVFFPSEYPNSPMLVHLVTTGHGTVRFNPNLYNDGKVCLSVLNTWHGRPEEKWNQHTSSFLQVLVSIQSLILVPEPYFNEPGYEQHRGTPYGDQKSLLYNANLFISTIQWAMIDQIKNPCSCFKEVILKHFYLRRKEILSQCQLWKNELMEGIKEHGANLSIGMEYLKNLKKQIQSLNVLLSKLEHQKGEELDIIQ